MDAAPAHLPGDTSSSGPAVPPIYSRTVLPPAISWWARLLAAVIALAALTVLGIGAWLQPHVSGISTHTALGFLPCQFEQRTGLPCPSCGFTTSVSHFAHGNPLASFYTQPMGFLIALGLAAAVWVGSYIAITARPVHRLLSMIPTRGWVIVLMGFAIGGWAWKIFLHLSGRGGW